MDFISIVGLAVAVGAILGGQILEGGKAQSLMQLTAFFIVIGGTMGAIMLQTTSPAFMQGLRLIKWVFMPPHEDPHALIREVVDWSQTSRKVGILGLEPAIERLGDPFQRKGLQMLVDGFEPQKIREELETEISSYEEYQRQAAKVWEGAGGYAPTIGILGAVMGLIHVMENLSDPSKLGGGIAVAFVATIYGVGSANLVFLPMANKLKNIIARQVTIREMMIEGLCAIANGENPRNIETRLQAYIA
ncbi:MAG: flagellar motor protein [Thermodesulfobacteriota bacterium]